MQESIDWRIVAAILSPLVATAAIITNYFLVKKQLSSTVIANERREWINTVRSDVASFVASIITVISTKAHYNTSNSDANYIIYRDAISKAALLQVKIQILLDQNDSSQKNLHEQIERIVDLINLPQMNAEEVCLIADSLVPLTQQIIKQKLHSIKQIM